MISSAIPLGLKCRLAVPTDQIDEEKNAINRIEDLTAGDTAADMERNKTLFKQICRNVYRYEWDQRLALDEAMDMFPDAVELANKMKDNSQPLVRYDQATVNAAAHINSIYLRVMNEQGAKHTDAGKYLRSVEEQICKTLGMPISKISVGSEDQYKITLLQNHTPHPGFRPPNMGNLRDAYKMRIFRRPLMKALLGCISFLRSGRPQSMKLS